MSTARPALTFTIPGAMKGKGRPRASSFGGHTRLYTPTATVNAEAHVKACCLQQIGQPMLDGPLDVAITIHAEIPASWSGRKRAAALARALRPTGKPDIDNSVKLIFDALNKLAWRDDAQVVRLSVGKFYAPTPGTVVTIAPADVAA